MYLPYSQAPVSFMNIVVKTQGTPRSVVGVLQAQVASVDPKLPVYNVRTVEEMLDATVAPRRLTMALLTVFAAVALLLASVGIYGVMSYTVTQRGPEIGIMMALGAPRATILKDVVTRGMILVGTGLAIGVLGSLALTRYMTSVLFEVAPIDPYIFVAVPLILASWGF